MTTLTRRLGRLEAGCRQDDEIVADRCRNIHKAAFRHLSRDQLKCLHTALISYQRGCPWTSDESAVVAAFDTATREECRKAGIPVAEFVRHMRQAAQT